MLVDPCYIPRRSILIDGPPFFNTTKTSVGEEGPVFCEFPHFLFHLLLTSLVYSPIFFYEKEVSLSFKREPNE